MVRVEHDVAARQYEVYVDDRRAGLAGYRDEGGRRVLTHTEVDPEYGGRGLAGRLGQRALDPSRAARARLDPPRGYTAP